VQLIFSGNVDFLILGHHLQKNLRANWLVTKMSFPTGQTFASVWMSVADPVDTSGHGLTLVTVDSGPTIQTTEKINQFQLLQTFQQISDENNK
jgi:hypothetical protein